MAIGERKKKTVNFIKQESCNRIDLKQPFYENRGVVHLIQLLSHLRRLCQSVLIYNSEPNRLNSEPSGLTSKRPLLQRFNRGKTNNSHNPFRTNQQVSMTSILPRQNIKQWKIEYKESTHQRASYYQPFFLLF